MKKNNRAVKVIALTLILLGVVQFLLPLLIERGIIKPNENTSFHLSIVNSVILILGGLISLTIDIDVIEEEH